MEKQEVKSILDRLFELSYQASEKGYTLLYSHDTINLLSLFFFPGTFQPGLNPVVNSTRFMNMPDGKILIEHDIKLIESHLNS